ncbi:MAG: stage 0 sporulation family protein [Lachnospiraceae bacterium]|nr:stage 0 sporulation family protein [Lachnospiraceae bacterium]
MKKVIGVRFKNAGKSYSFDPGDLEITGGMKVIVETSRGIELGSVLYGIREVDEASLVAPLKKVIRIATEEDLERAERNAEKEKTAYHTCKEKIAEHGLEMKLVKAEYTFDNSKLLFYFTADGRVDFRELVKDLAAEFHIRIELRQIGVRDETKILGGLGVCGRELCCSTFLSEFAPVSIKMAKEQNLSLNPTKISGVCGRLMCCLNNEEETYEYLNKTMPRVGEEVVTTTGETGIVTSVNILRQKMKVVVETDDMREIREYLADEIVSHQRKKKNPNNQGNQNKDDSNQSKAEAEETVENNENKHKENHHKKNKKKNKNHYKDVPTGDENGENA